MKKHKRIIIFTLLLIGVTLMVATNKFKAVTSDAEYYKSDIMEPNEMRSDFVQVKTIVDKNHPKIILEGYTEEQLKLIEDITEKIAKPLSLNEFRELINIFLASLGDAHTGIQPKFEYGNNFIDFYSVWLKDGLYVQESIGKLEKGDNVLSIGGVKTEDLLDLMKEKINADNYEGIKGMSHIYLSSEFYLRMLNLVDSNKVKFEVERNGEIENIKLELRPMNASEFVYKFQKNFDELYSEENWIGYEIDGDNSLGIFELNSFTYDNNFKKVLNEFFSEVSENNIDNIVIDLRSNTGGNGDLVYEFLTYIDINSYNDFSLEKFSGGKKYYEREGKLTENNQVEEGVVFSGNLYVLTSMHSNSSSSVFASMIKENNIGLVIGENTANIAPMYANPEYITLNNSNIECRVSTTKLVPVNATIDYESEYFVTPNIEVNTTVKHIMNGVDPQMEKMLELIK